jgi:hypothetical protein
MRLIATTVVRESIRGKQRTGYIYDIDWDAQRVRRRLPVPEPRHPESDDNPRGGVRGGRGVAVTREGIVLANHDTLFRYDDSWKVLDEISHPLTVGLHEIDWDGTNLWAAATRIDAVLKVGLDGSVEAAWDPHTSPLAGRYGLRPRPDPLDGTVDYRVGEARPLDECHLNGVACMDDVLIVNCGLVRRPKPRLAKLANRTARKLGLDRRARELSRNVSRSLVVALTGSGPPEILIEFVKHNDFPTHNGQRLDAARIAVNDSTHNTLRIFGADGAQLRAVQIPGKWLRGLEPLDDHRAFVGTAPAAVVLVDVEEGRIERALPLSENPYEAVHGLTLFPSPSDQR